MMARFMTMLLGLALFSALPLGEAANAADQAVRHRAWHGGYHHYRGYARDCGCCGCWYPEYVRHHQVLYTYPSDPRYTLTSEPRYVRGHVRTYLHNLF